MATFSLGTSGITPGAPGVYINEQAGLAANAAIADFSTVYMLVETEEDVPVTKFPFNVPVPVTSLNDYKELIRVGTTTVPNERIPLLSYNCVNEFFQNSQVGDLRVVRVGTPDQIVEIEFSPASTKLNTTELPSALFAGNTVYVQVIINGIKLVSGDGSTGYTSEGEWLGVPVEIPVTYVSGDQANNRKISAAINAAVAEAIESNPAVRSSVYVRKVGMVNDIDPSGNSENSYITIASTTYNGNVSVITEVLPVGSNFVFMQNAYNISNIVGGSVSLERVPQDYAQCIDTAFEGQQDQGYLITPTAYAQFDAAGRALIGAAAANHCESNSYKWMALADPGPFLVTDINEYKDFVPHKPAADLVEGKSYLTDNVIYKWVGNDVNYNKLTHQTIVYGENAETAINQSANLVADGSQVGLLDPATYEIAAIASASRGVFELGTYSVWPVTLPIQQVTLTGAGVGNDFTAVYVRGYADDAVGLTGPIFGVNNIVTGAVPVDGVYTNEAITGTGTGGFATVTVFGGAITSVVVTDGGTNYLVGSTVTFTNVAFAGSSFDVQNVDVLQNISNTEVFVVAAPYDLRLDSEYPRNYVLLTTNAVDASNVYNSVVLGEGSAYVTYSPIGSVYMPTPTGDVALLRYVDPYWDLPVDINGQTSDLIENISGQPAGVNTLHLPSTLQDPTQTYILNWISRTIMDPSSLISSYAGTIVATGSASFNVVSHGLRTGQKIYFTQPIELDTSGRISNLISATNKLVSRPYWVKVIDQDSFAVSNSLANFSTGQFVAYPSSGVISSSPTIFYSQMLGRGLTTISPTELITLPMIRARKYEFDTNVIWNQALDASLNPPGVTVADNPNVSIYLNNSSVVLGEDQISPFGEDISASNLCGYLPKLNLVDPDPTPTPATLNAYCVPTVDQFFQAEAYFVPAIDPIYVGDYDGGVSAAPIGPVLTVTGAFPIATVAPDNVYNNVATTSATGTGLTLTINVAGGSIQSAVVNNAGQGYNVGDVINLPTLFGGVTLTVATIDNPYGFISSVVPGGYGAALLGAGAVNWTAAQMEYYRSKLVGSYFDVVNNGGFAPDGSPVVVGDRIVLTYNGTTYDWVVVPSATLGGDLTSAGQPCYGSQVELTFAPEQAVPTNLWRFDAITSTEIFDAALRGTNFNGIPQAQFIEAGVDNVNRLFEDSQRYFNPFGFIAFYGPWIENGAGQYIPPSPYVTGVAVRRYRAEGYQFPPAGIKYQLADAVSAQIPINSTQQNLLNPKGCNAVRTLPGYPDSAVFIWGGRTRVNPDDAQQRLYQFVNTRVILNVVYGSLRSAFDSQIFNVIDGFGIVYNQIISIGNSILNQLYVRGALFGATPSDAFQVICDSRINLPENLENGIVQAQVYVTPVPTLERIQIDLIRVAIGKMQEELDIRGLGSGSV